eukprot:11968358-Alexandrium_andersonii.AAC.1
MEFAPRGGVCAGAFHFWAALQLPEQTLGLISWRAVGVASRAGARFASGFAQSSPARERVLVLRRSGESLIQ